MGYVILLWHSLSLPLIIFRVIFVFSFLFGGGVEGRANARRVLLLSFYFLSSTDTVPKREIGIKDELDLKSG